MKKAVLTTFDPVVDGPPTPMIEKCKRNGAIFACPCAMGVVVSFGRWLRWRFSVGGSRFLGVYLPRSKRAWISPFGVEGWCNGWSP
jgi:hypothetical protein